MVEHIGIAFEAAARERVVVASVSVGQIKSRLAGDGVFDGDASVGIAGHILVLDIPIWVLIGRKWRLWFAFVVFWATHRVAFDGGNIRWRCRLSAIYNHFCETSCDRAGRSADETDAACSKKQREDGGYCLNYQRFFLGGVLSKPETVVVAGEPIHKVVGIVGKYFLIFCCHWRRSLLSDKHFVNNEINTRPGSVGPCTFAYVRHA